MDTPTTRGFTPARIVALVVIAAVAMGLAALRFASSTEPVVVPPGAKAGDLLLERCTYATQDGDYDADCGTLVVPENRADPQSRLIALPVTRIRARSDQPAEPIFRLEGGPASRTWSTRWRAASPRTTTSSSSASGAWTAPCGSSARR